MPSPEILLEPRPTSDAPPRARPAPRRTKRRPFGKGIGLLFIALLLWTAWAIGAFYDLRSGLQDADPVALERRIDWTSVRQGLREELQQRAALPAGGGASPGSPSSDPSIDALLSRQAVINLLRTAGLDDRGWETSRPAQPVSARERVFDWYRIRYASYSGGLLTFRVDISPSSDKIKRPLILLFTWRGDWRLTRVFLPTDADIKPASQTPSAAVSSLAPAPQPLPPGTQRVVLFEENPSDPQGKRYTGSVVWRTEETTPAEGGAPELAVTAHVAIPERPLAMTMAIRRNLDKTLPASHIIEIRFDLPSNYSAGGVQDVLGVMMKPNDEATGQQLVGTRVKVSNDFFLIGLSAIDLDLQRNVQILKERPWFGVPFQYSNKNRAVMAIEKGPIGQNSIVDALARWSTKSVTESAAPKP